MQRAVPPPRLNRLPDPGWLLRFRAARGQTPVVHTRSARPRTKDYPGDQPTITRGFTLVEMLVVMTVIVILLVIAAPTVNSILKGSQITQGAQMLSAEFALAKQIALTKNCSVELRLYQWADPSVQGETSQQLGKYRAMQMFRVNHSPTDNTATYVALDRVQILPNTVFIDSGSTLSTLITPPTGQMGTSPTITNGTTLNASLPQPGKAYNCVLFHFFPSGTTDLPSSAQWFLTLHNINDGDNLPATPKNFFTVQINPLNGHLRNFRP